jgi:hypothetical protein
MSQNPTPRVQELDVDLELIYRLWSHLIGRTSRDGRAEPGAHEFPVQGGCLRRIIP